MTLVAQSASATPKLTDVNYAGHRAGRRSGRCPGREGMMGRTRIIGVAAVLTTAAVLGIGGAASAKPLGHGDFHDEFSELVPNFCESAGLTVQIDGVVDGKFLVNTRGRDDLVYFKEHLRIAVMYTNVNNDKFVTSRDGR